MVFYRKYRPQKIKELDSEEIRNRLSSVLSAKSSPHAFLFTGPKGLGKTSAARIVAKVLNCEKQKAKSKKQKEDIEPCNKCLQCVSITNGTNMDVLEIDGASNRGIDEIRDLREKIKLLPIAASKKVYIIDEVHMLTTEAFNALLKTLEEPPPHAVFILCTTEPQKVPPTIVSRCSHFPFRRATQEELVRAFTRIAGEEKLPIEKEILVYLALLSDGSFRDGVKILEELILISDGKKITKELVEEKYQVSSIKYQVSSMLEFLAAGDAKRGLELVTELVEQGVEMKYFLQQMISELHFMLLAKVGVGESGSRIENLELKIDEIKKLIELLTKAYGEIKFAVLPQLPLELAIVEWGEKPRNQAEQYAEQHRDPVQRSLASGSASFGGKDEKQEESKGENDIWNQLIAGVKSHNHSVAGVLRGCKLKSFDGKKLLMETGYKFHKERLEERKTRDVLEKVCEEITGNPVSVSVLLKGGR